MSLQALCKLEPNDKSGVEGLIRFQQEGDKCIITGEISGLTPGDHGFHIHAFGDRTNGCTSTGGHFNPYGQDHGGPSDADRHVGDLGNITADDSGKCCVAITDEMVKLSGEQSIIGRAVVVHADKDDLGKGGFTDSKTTGHAGGRIACGVIGLAQ